MMLNGNDPRHYLNLYDEGTDIRVFPNILNSAGFSETSESPKLCPQCEYLFQENFEKLKKREDNRLLLLALTTLKGWHAQDVPFHPVSIMLSSCLPAHASERIGDSQSIIKTLTSSIEINVPAR